jgi:hypothetical protein
MSYERRLDWSPPPHASRATTRQPSLEKALRGNGQSKIEKRERIVLIVNHEASTKTPAILIRSTAA